MPEAVETIPATAIVLEILTALGRKADPISTVYVANNAPVGETFQSEREVKSGRIGIGETTVTPSGLRTEGEGVGVGVGVDVGVGVALRVGVGVDEAVGDGEGEFFGVEPTTQMFPAGSTVAVVAISLPPLSRGRDHCTVPVASNAWINPSVLTTPVIVPKR